MQYAKIVVRKCVRLVDAQSALVVDLRFVEPARLEREIAQIDHRGHASGVLFKRLTEVAFSAGPIAQTQPADTALAQRLCGLIAGCDGRIEQVYGLRKGAALVGGHGVAESGHDRRTWTVAGGSPSDGERAIRMRIDVITLFPQFFGPIVEGSILGRSQAKGVVQIHIHDLWEYVLPGERADDAPYGGGPGMILRLGPLLACVESLLGPELTAPADCRIIVASPAGPRFDQTTALALTAHQRLIIICGHYEGIDERFFALVNASELSLGDFVLTGGEIPALAFIDACVRLLPGAINPQSTQAESFRDGRLDWPHYTRPATFRGLTVPDVLLSGDHASIARWRTDAAKNRTAERRPDLNGSESGEER